MRNKDLITRRNKLIYEQYATLWGSGLREELIWPKLVESFHLQQDTIYRIVLEQSRIAKACQPEIEFEGGVNGAN